MAERTPGGQLKQLGLALINATLILLAVCLWLGWSALSAADRVTDKLTAAAEMVVPLREDVQALTAELADTRTQLANRSSARNAALEARLEGIETQLAQMNEALGTIATDAETLIAAAVQAAFREAGIAASDRLRPAANDELTQ